MQTRKTNPKTTGRDGQTRTGNPSLPKRVRYQLRYVPTRIKRTVKYSTLFQGIVQANFSTGVNGGDRTHDPQSHNLMLYQLSYVHHTPILSQYTYFFDWCNRYSSYKVTIIIGLSRYSQEE
jgi:hypothetical protein